MTPNILSTVPDEWVDLCGMAEVSLVHEQLNIMTWHYDKIHYDEGKLVPGKSLSVIAYSLCKMSLHE